jgi:uncharacterized protein (DUF1330 family)
MAAYVIANVDVKDPAGYEEYRKLVPATIEKYGGKYLVRGGAFEKLEGEWQPKRLVVLEFGSLDQARRWYMSEEYRPAKALRKKSAASDLIVVEGA